MTQPGAAGVHRPAGPAVLHVRSSAGLYGAEYMLLGLLPALAAAGVRAELASIENHVLGGDPLRAAAEARGIAVTTLPCRGRIDWRTVRALRALLAARKADLVHAHDYKSAAYAFLATRGTRAKRVATLHGWTDTTAALKWYRRIELAVLRRFDAVCAVSEPQRTALIEAGVPASRVRVVANGVDTERYVPRTNSAHGAAHHFGTAARLSPEKNLAALIEAFSIVRASHPPVRLSIAGDGCERAALAALIEERKLADSVALLGRRDDLEAFYPTLDTFVLSSRTEGMPMAMLEAMACARCVVATAVGSIPTLLSHAGQATVVPPNDVPALARALAARVGGAAEDPAARRFVLQHASLAHMADAYARAYRDTLGARDARVAA